MAIYETLYNLKNFGIRGEELVVAVGGNAKMNEFSAIMGLCNLKHVDQAIEKRKTLVEEYERQLDGILGITFFRNQPGVEKNYGYFPVLVDEKFKMSRNELYEKLKSTGICARKYFYPLTSDQVCFRNKYKQFELENARWLSKNILALPIYENLKKEEIKRIIDVFKG